jgi:hypothetical protein
VSLIQVKNSFESRHILADMLASTVLPIKVQYALRDFDTTIEEDLELMFDVLNDRFSHIQMSSFFMKTRNLSIMGR